MSKSRSKTTQRRAAIAQRIGTVTVEFAVCSAVFFMIAFSGFEFCRFMFARHSVDQATFEAARVGIIPGNHADDAIARAQSFLNAAGIRNANISVTPAVIDDETESVTVTVNCSFADNSWIPSRFLVGSTIQSSVTLDHENNAYRLPADAGDGAGDNDNEPIDI